MNIIGATFTAAAEKPRLCPHGKTWLTGNYICNCEFAPYIMRVRSKVDERVWVDFASGEWELIVVPLPDGIDTPSNNPPPLTK